MDKPIACLLLAATAASAGEPAAQVAASTGGFDISMLDRAVDPCVDFYQFACGGWRARNPIPADQTRWGRFNELAERNREDLRAILEQARDASRARSATQARVGDYYAACMDEAGIEARGKAEVQPFIARIEALATRGSSSGCWASTRPRGCPRSSASARRPTSTTRARRSRASARAGWGCPTATTTSRRTPRAARSGRSTGSTSRARSVLLGDPPEAALAGAEAVLRLETALAKAHLDRVAMRDPKNRDNPMTLAELKQLAPAIEWDAYLRATGAPAFTRLNVTSRPYFEGTSRIVAETPLPDWKSYLRWHVARAASPFLADAFVRENYRFFREYLQGAREIEPRYKRCVQATDRALGDALGELYVEKTFGADGKARMKKMIEAITAAMREDIEGLDWMTAETKPKALAKLAAFGTGKIGYPDAWKDYAPVEVKRDDHLGNSLRAQVFEIRALDGSDRQADRSHALEHDAAHGERVLQRGQQRDRLPGGNPAAAVLRPRRRRRGQLRRDRCRDRPRVHPRLRRPGQQVRRRRQPAQLVDARRTARRSTSARPASRRSTTATSWSRTRRTATCG